MDYISAIIVAFITGIFSLIGVVLTNSKAAASMDAKLEKNQAVMETKLVSLTEEVRKHNGFATRLPVVEEQIKVINHRIEDLERSDKK